MHCAVLFVRSTQQLLIETTQEPARAVIPSASIGTACQLAAIAGEAREAQRMFSAVEPLISVCSNYLE
jgi:hypothetical protein